MVYDHGIEGMAFFHMEIPDVPPPEPSLSALVMVLGDGVASPEMIEAELNHLCRCQWDWQVTPTAGHQFSELFPDIVSHGYCTRSAEITLALNKLVVDIFEPKVDPKLVAVLDTAWILIAGLLDIARSERVIRNMSRILGKVVVVDELSLRKEEEVQVKTKSLDSNKLRATVRVFFNDLDYDIKISPEPPNHIGRPRFSDDGNNGGGHGDNGRGDYSNRRRRHPSDDEEDYSEHSRSPSRDPPASRLPRGASGGGAALTRAPLLLPASPSASGGSDVSGASMLVASTSSPRSPASPSLFCSLGLDLTPATEPSTLLPVTLADPDPDHAPPLADASPPDSTPVAPSDGPPALAGGTMPTGDRPLVLLEPDTCLLPPAVLSPVQARTPAPLPGPASPCTLVPSAILAPNHLTRPLHHLRPGARWWPLRFPLRLLHTLTPWDRLVLQAGEVGIDPGVLLQSQRQT